MAPSVAPVSADDLYRARFPDKRVELVRGAVIVREPAGGLHGRVAMNFGVELAVHVKHAAAGAVFAAETGFKLASNPDTVRAPDVAFIAEVVRRRRRRDGAAAGAWAQAKRRGG